MINIPFFEKKNFLNDRDFKLVENEVLSYKDVYIPLYFGETQIYRIDLDEIFRNRREESAILSIIYSNLYDKELISEVSKYDDLAFKLYGLPHKYHTFLSQMRESKEYREHDDIHGGLEWNKQFMSWIYYMNDDFEGSELVVKVNDEEIIIKPEKNKLILLPAYRRHSINKPIYNEGSNFRTTINGFMYIQ